MRKDSSVLGLMAKQYELSPDIALAPNKRHTIEVVVDRLVRRDGIQNRLAGLA